MIGDLVRYLQKYQYLCFKQTYRKPKDDEVMPKELHEVQVSILDNDKNRKAPKLNITYSNHSNNKSKGFRSWRKVYQYKSKEIVGSA